VSQIFDCKVYSIVDRSIILESKSVKILVTGGAGFIGSHLAEALNNIGHSLIVIDSLSSFLYPDQVKIKNIENFNSKGIEFHKVDLYRDNIEQFVKSAEVIINLAAIPGLVKSWDFFDKYVESNLLAVGKLLESCKSANVQKLVQISTSSVYGKIATGNENSKLNPFSPYGVSKLAAENLVNAYSANFNIPTTILRYFSVYGPRQRPDMAYQKIIKSVLSGHPIEIYGNGEQTRTNTFVDDIVNGTINAMEAGSETDGKTYNLAGREKISLIEAVHLIEKIIGKKAKIVHTPARDGDQMHTSGDISAAVKDFAFNPTTDFISGIERQIKWNLKI